MAAKEKIEETKNEGEVRQWPAQYAAARRLIEEAPALFAQEALLREAAGHVRVYTNTLLETFEDEDPECYRPCDYPNPSERLSAELTTLKTLVENIQATHPTPDPTALARARAILGV